jgi:pimeloyl-ACP methyl ester carboxylesterase
MLLMGRLFSPGRLCASFKSILKSDPLSIAADESGCEEHNLMSMPGAGEHVVFIHGMASGPGVWAAVERALEPRFDVHPVAMLGHRGGAPVDRWAAQGSLAEALVDDVERQMDELGLHQAHLVGNSMGGWVSLRLAERGRALSVTCLAPAGGWRPGRIQELALVTQFALARLVCRALFAEGRPLRRSRRARAIMLRNVCAHPESLDEATVHMLIDDLAGCTALDGVLRHGGRRAMAQVTAVTDPTTIAWSAEDAVLRRPATRAGYASFPDWVEQVVLEGVGHVPMLDDPLCVAEVIQRTVDRAPHTGASAATA